MVQDEKKCIREPGGNGLWLIIVIILSLTRKFGEGGDNMLTF